MLGIEDLPVKVQSGVIGRLEMFALFTDGLTELFDRDEKMLDVEGLEKGLVEQFMRSPGASAAEYAEGLTRFLDEYQGGRAAGDDRTFLLGRLS